MADIAINLTQALGIIVMLIFTALIVWGFLYVVMVLFGGLPSRKKSQIYSHNLKDFHIPTYNLSGLPQIQPKIGIKQRIVPENAIPIKPIN
jgi:hypothetical protein